MNLNNIIAQRPTKTVYRDGDLTVKVFDESHKKSDVLNEALNLARVEETGLPIPALVDVEKIDGKWAIVTQYIEGKTLAQLMEENPEKIDEYMELFIDIQTSIHEKKAPLLGKHKDKMHRKISETDLDATTRYELHTRLEGMPKHDKVLHGDFRPSNVIIGSDGVNYIIDWAHVTRGNAAADAARTYLVFSLKGEPENAEKYMQMYCKKTDTARQYVQKWLPVVAATQLLKNRKEERALLMHWLDVVEYE